MPLVLCVPARRLASCQLTMRARMSRRTGRPKIASDSSMLPTSLLSRFLTWSFMSLASALGRCGLRRGAQRRREGQILGRFALGRVLHQHIAAFGAWHRPLDEEKPALGVGRDHAQVLRGDALVAVMTCHLLVLEHLARVLALPGRAVAAVRNRDAVRRAQTAEIMPA